MIPLNLVFFIVIFFLYILRTLKNILYHLFWWENKEYRFDRMLIHLTQTYQGRYWIFHPLSLVKWVAFIVYLIPIENTVLINLTNLTVVMIYAVEGLKSLSDWKSGLKIPSLGKRSFIIFNLVLVTSAVLLLWWLNPSDNRSFFYFLLVDKLIAVNTAMFILFSNLLFTVHKNIKISKAKQKFDRYNRIKVIGITGSYGKTTTKEILGQILSAKFQIIRTDKSKNSDIAVAEKILESNLIGIDYFVCEMGAYKSGEIKSICSMLNDKIQIAIITGINEQHQGLFGNIQNTLKAKFELIEAVSGRGLVLFNEQSKHIKSLISKAKKLHLNIKSINPAEYKMFFHTFKDSYFVECLSLAIAAAKSLGMTDEEINKQLDQVQLPEKNMKKIMINKTSLIDNTFNSNPNGVYAALDYLNRQKGKKYFVFQPIIELGNSACDIHQKIGYLSASVCDNIILTNKNYMNCFIRGVAKVSGGLNKISMNRDLSSFYSGTILFEGKETAGVLNHYLGILKNVSKYEKTN